MLPVMDLKLLWLSRLRSTLPISWLSHHSLILAQWRSVKSVTKCRFN